MNRVLFRTNRSLAPSTARPTQRSAGCLFLLCVTGTWATGCGSGLSRIDPPSIDADDAASAALADFDQDGDGLLSGSELDAAPGLKASLGRTDTDGDGKISEDEIADRIRAWQATRRALIPVQCTVVLDGRPLADAEITLEPEAFLGDRIQAAIGTTAGGGEALPSVPKDKRPTSDSPPGVHLGMYRVKVSKMAGGMEMVPAQYNEQTTLGQEIALDDPALLNNRVIFQLKSK